MNFNYRDIRQTALGAIHFFNILRKFHFPKFIQRFPFFIINVDLNFALGSISDILEINYLFYGVTALCSLIAVIGIIRVSITRLI